MRWKRLGFLVALVFAGTRVAPAAAGAETAEAFRLTEVRSGVFAAIARTGDTGTVGNAGFIVGSDAVLVVDSFATPGAAGALLARIRQTTKLPVRWLVNTHFHRDHCGGNAVFVEAGAIVVAHENARSRMRDAMQGQPGEPAKSGERGTTPGFALPSETYRDALTIWLGERRVDVFSRPGHTDGDSLVSVPDDDVLFGGDLLQKSTVPNLANADTEAWVRTLDELAVRFPRAALVPGHGDVARPLDMRSLRDYLVNLRLAVSRELARGKSGAALADALVPQFTQRLRGWSGTEHIGETVTQMEAALRDKAAAPAPPTPTP